MYITFLLQVLFKTVEKTSKKCLKFMIVSTSRFCDPYQDKFRAVEEKISYRTCNSINFHDREEFQNKLFRILTSHGTESVSNS